MADNLNAYAKPPTQIREVYKEYQKAKIEASNEQNDLIQFPQPIQTATSRLSVIECLKLPEELRQIFYTFAAAEKLSKAAHLGRQCKVYQVTEMPGLLIFPNLLPPPTQLALLDKLLHRDVANPQHQTNLHLHYNVPYPETSESYFSPASKDLNFQPKDPTIHKSLNIEQFLNKKLRWATLGGQYDWTNKVYPSTAPPGFPPDIKQLIEDIFPMKAEAAIVNLYSPGDTLSLHRDVSEECNRPLVSISLGCDAIFICGLDAEPHDSLPRVAVMRLQSGDAVLMSGESRYAWHGVPKVVSGTCPEWMESWPAALHGDQGGEYEHWRGWMKGKRVNLNVRQMFE